MPEKFTYDDRPLTADFFRLPEIERFGFLEIFNFRFLTRMFEQILRF
ncbi:MAG: hypothetical protein LH472_13750 [Pyrinomonadaceae bacterium]|nr:hypothetical protein [Pyrinomonadaceae bacterium]